MTASEVIVRAKSDFNDMRVVRVGQRIDLDVDGATHATWHPTQVLTGYSWDALTVGALLGQTTPTRALILGMGGGTVARQLRHCLPRMRITGVEIDALVVALAKTHLALNSDDNVVIGDAYDFVGQCDDTFDVIIDDLFLSGPDDVMRARTPEGKTLQLMQQRLAPGGVLVANTIIDEGAHLDVADATLRAFQGAFTSVATVHPPRGLNRIVVGSSAPLGGLDRARARGHAPWSTGDAALFHKLRVQPVADVVRTSSSR
jgi:spermidine synthase